MASVVLITGVGRYLGGRLAARLSQDASIERIIAVDTEPPRRGPAGLGRAEFVRADIRHPLIAKVLDQARVDTVVHPPAGRDAAVTLADAAQRSRTLERFVAASTTAVYGAGPRDPAVFDEDQTSVSDLPPGPARVAVDVETRLRALARVRRDLVVSVLRLTTLVGPTVENWLTRLLALPLVPMPFGFDPRLQLLHETDAVEILARAVVAGPPGVVNAAADGVVPLTQALRWAARLPLPLPPPLLAAAGPAVGPEVARYLCFGRAVDTTRLHTELGYVPQYTTAQALLDHLDARPGLPGPSGVAAAALAAVQRILPRVAT
jgi:UDP-glucose 4-epimerase